MFKCKRTVCTLVLMLFCLGALLISGAAEEKGTDLSLPYRVSTASSVSSVQYTVTASEGGFLVDNGVDGTEYSDLSLAIDTIPSGAAVRLDGVSYDGTLYIRRDMTLLGELTLNDGSLIASSCSLTLDGVRLNFIGGSLLIKGAEVTMTGGEIASDTDGVVLDFSASDSFTMRGGTIATTGCAVVLKRGSASITSGEITSAASYAISSSAVLTLGGEPRLMGAVYDMYINEPLLASGAGCTLTDITILADMDISRGLSTPVVLNAGVVSYEDVRVFDMEYNEYSPRLIGECYGTLERDFLSVHLPYTLTLFDGSTKLSEYEYLRGEVPAKPTDPTREGYAFLGWYSDYSLKCAFSFSEGMSGDLNIFASFSLLPPAYDILPLDFIYDAKPRELALYGVSHPLDALGSFSYEWYKNDSAINAVGDRISVRYTGDSGSYKCKITFAYMGDFVSVTTPEVAVNISKRQIEAPKDISVEYTGAYQSPTLNTDGLYTVEQVSVRDVGAYTVEVLLTDSVNCEFSGISSASCSFIFEITRAKNSFDTAPTVGRAFVGAPPSVDARARFGEFYVEYFASGAWTASYPDEVGDYMLRAAVAPSQNYEGAYSVAVAFTVEADACVGIGITVSPLKTEYLAFEKVDLSGAEIFAGYLSGKRQTLSHSMITVNYNTGESLRVFDKSVTLSFEGVSLPLSVSVSPREYDTSRITLEKSSFTYSARPQRPTVSCDVVGLDGIALAYTVRGAATDVGTYSAYIDFSTESFNYITPKSMELSFEIIPMDVYATFGEVAFIYDKLPKVPSAHIVSATGDTVYLQVSGSATDAGEYVATAIAPNENYRILNPSVDFKIDKAQLDLSGVVWSCDEFDYDGEVHTVTLSCLPEGVSVVGYAGRSATEAGEYLATASLYYDTRNYISDGYLTHKYKINPIRYDLSGIAFLDATYTYDGSEKHPRLQGLIPKGHDGSSPELTFVGAPSDATDGTTVKITFVSNSKNYIAPDAVYATVRILPKQIEVVWSGLEFVYDGEAKLPLAYSPECTVTVFGDGIDAGSYIATAKPASSNFEIINPSVVFTVKRKRNAFLEQPSIVGGFAGDELHPLAAAKFGVVSFSYYEDISLLKPATLPLAAGSYYMVACVAEGKNYEGIISDPIPFTVTAVKPISLTARLRSSSLIAYRGLTGEDIEAFYLNNNGSSSEIPFGELTLSYQSADSPRVGDNELHVSAGGFSFSLSVNVLRADYDMSGVFWTVTRSVYNGEMVTSTLEGLPSGVSVSLYTSNTGKNAGVYPLCATLDYDSVNYNPPVLPAAYLTVEKRTVALPEDMVFVYDGQEKKLDLKNSEYYLGGVLCASSAGRYLLSVVLLDEENYRLDREGVSLIIEPRPITLRVTDENGSYIFESGNAVSNDNLGISTYEKDGIVYVSVQNTNYIAEIIPFDITQNESDTWIVLLIILIAMILGTLLYIAYIRRESILAFAGALRVRFFTKSHRGEPPTDSSPRSSTTLLATDARYADSAISDYLAKSLIRKGREAIYTTGNLKYTALLCDISRAFSSSDKVDINSLKAKGIVPEGCSYVRIEGGGVIDKALHITADSFSLTAVKMIALTGGTATKSRTRIKRKK